MNAALLRSILDALDRSGIDRLIVVPASGLNPIYEDFGRRGRCLYATREEEAIAIAAGLALGGGHPLVLMQQAGVGNALNAVFSLADAYEIDFPILVFDRGEDDPNLVQRVSSQRTARVLAAVDCEAVDFLAPDAAARFRRCVEQRRRWIRFAF